jgi:hypothetical protein
MGKKTRSIAMNSISLQTLVQAEKEFQRILKEHQTAILNLAPADFLQEIKKTESAWTAYHGLEREIQAILKQQVQVTE